MIAFMMILPLWFIRALIVSRPGRAHQFAN
jgi:hypothetical protein